MARPFIKWNGGKTRLLPEILRRIPDIEGVYYEPFLGGGAVFFALESIGQLRPRDSAMRAVFKPTLSDANAELIDTYKAIRNTPAGVILALDHIAALHLKNPAETFARIRDVVPADLDDKAAVAARMIYLNKAGFNGLYRVNRKGVFNVPFGKKAADFKFFDPDSIREISAALSCTNLDACRYDQIPTPDPGDFVFLDPPYHPISKTADFTKYTADGFTADDQLKLRDWAAGLKQRGVGVLISNSDCDFIRNLYAGWKVEAVEIFRGGGTGKGRKRITELLIS
jgi:DNA adenine methylase